MIKKKSISALLMIIFLFLLTFTSIYVQESYPSFMTTLQYGTIGYEVSRLQSVLSQFPDVYPEALITGYFGILTRKAVIRFQLKIGLSPQDARGVVGPITRAKLNEIITAGQISPYRPVDSASETDITGQSSSTMPIENPDVSLSQKQVSVGLPLRIKIPSIDVDVPIEYVGFTSDGAMAISNDLANVAWYNLGTRPGEIGSAVMAGHSGIKNGKALVFNDLSKLRPGDKLYINDDQGATFTFVVRESKIYDPQADTLEIFTSNDGKVHLNLITCEGTWNKATQNYSKRLVVFADKKMPEQNTQPFTLTLRSGLFKY